MTGFAELVAATHFSFLRGAAAPADMVAQAIALGHAGLGIADRNTVAGVVRAHLALKEGRERAAQQGHDADLLKFRLVVGARLVFADDTPDIVVHPADRRGWGRLTRLLTQGNRRAEKGQCHLTLADFAEHCGGWLAIQLPPEQGQSCRLNDLKDLLGDALWQGADMPRQGNDRRRLHGLIAAADAAGVPLLATNAPLLASPSQRPLQDVLTCIREHCRLAEAGLRLSVNAERHLKSPAAMARLFHEQPQALAETLALLERVTFDLDQLGYEYPHEPVPSGFTPQKWLETLCRRKADARWPDGPPPKLLELLEEEFVIIERAGYAPYFLTVHDIVAYAQARGILCQGRGSAANSAVCYVLGITAVDPAEHNLLFSRFISEDRKEPPDIDVDFEHERREEVIQYIYQRYGRERAGIAATVIHYRPRSAVREVGKVLGFSEDVTNRLTGTVWGSFATTMEQRRFAESGLDPASPGLVRLADLVGQILHYPRHLSQHVGGFVLTRGRLDETVPIHNAAMPDRTFIEWDKDDLDALGIMKVDILALGMLTAIAKAFALIETHIGRQYTLANVPSHAPDVFDMLCEGDSVGVFQVESRAQMNMLPRLRPREFYDLAIQVAIVRPGPIQGEMVHPYLRRRQHREAPDFPSPAPPHPADELQTLLGRTLGIPLFQEQAMKLAITAAGFTSGEANRLRRSMATFRHVGGMEEFETKMIEGMVARGYQREFAARCFNQIKGFGSYGFPESHALAFARLVWVSSFLKCRFPAVFAAALLNSQPMGFYAPAQLVRDAAEHGVEVRPVDVNFSFWDNSLEPCDPVRPQLDGAFALRLGLRQISGFRAAWADLIVAGRPFATPEDMARAGLPRQALRMLADADACGSMGYDRRTAAWDVHRTPTDVLPLFAAMNAPELGVEPASCLPDLTLGENVAADYQTLRLSLKAHPMALLRGHFPEPKVLTAQQISVARNGRRASMAGVVLVRQRPGNGNAIFVTLEDETGVTNIVIWARLFENFRRAVMASRLMQVDGEVQRSPEGVVHLMASRIHDRTALLDTLSANHLARPDPAPADEFLEPDPRQAPAGARTRHPRDVRIIPKSRDFH